MKDRMTPWRFRVAMKAARNLLLIPGATIVVLVLVLVFLNWTTDWKLFMYWDIWMSMAHQPPPCWGLVELAQFFGMGCN